MTRGSLTLRAARRRSSAARRAAGARRPTAASAHPLGNFTVNRYSGLVVAADAVTVDHVLDLAEIPTAQRVARDRHRPATARCRRPSSRPWAATQCARRRPAACGSPSRGRGAALAVTARVRARPRRGRRACRPCAWTACCAAPRAVDGATTGRAASTPARDRPGRLARDDRARRRRRRWSRSDVPTRTASARLTAYPKDLLTSPLDVRGACTAGAPRRAAARGRRGPARRPAWPRVVGRLTGSFEGLLDPLPTAARWSRVTALLAALALGAAHAVAPGPRQDDHGVLPVRSPGGRAAGGRDRRRHRDRDPHRRRAGAGAAGQRRHGVRAGPGLPLAQRAVRRCWSSRSG